ncbi:MAG TPA: hypothetical protein VFQ36_04395 [Ktedonobacteraceae bacterium]|nr:hypothetical protein [Ktedonobacteraceae bacterium]
MSSVSELNAIVDEIFYVLEEVKGMLANWNASYHIPFIKMVMRINNLREQLHILGYTDDFVEILIKVAYHNVFSQDEIWSQSCPSANDL